MNRFTWTFIVVCTCNNWPSSNFAFISSIWGEAGQQQIASNFLWTEHFDCRGFDMFWHVVKRFVHRSPGLGCWRPTAQRPGCNSGAGRCLCQLGPKGSNPDHQPLESWQVHSTTLKVTGKFLPRKGSPVPMLSAPRSSELSKLVANAMLAQRVSSINSISRRSAVGKWKPMVHLGYRKSNHNPTKLAVQTCCV